MGNPRLLERLDDDERGSVPGKLQAFRIVFACVIVTEYGTKALARRGELAAGEFVALLLIALFGALTLLPRTRRSAFGGIAALQLWYVIDLFPLAGNHRYLEIVIAALLALLDEESEEERQWLLRSLRFTTIVVLFWSGVQKLAHGHWFRGQFLTFSTWRENFRTVLEPLLSPSESARLDSYSLEVGQGPFLASDLSLLLVSNGVWIAEIGLAVLLIPRWSRRFAWIAACVFLVLTEVAARELMFGVEFFCAMTLFDRGTATRRLAVPLLILLVWLWSVRLGLAPEVLFH